MSTSLKSKKPDLNALYRLEFYKKKNYWKFCKDVCKETNKKTELKPTAKKKSILKTTYNMAPLPKWKPQPESEPPPVSQLNSDFNNAFLENDLEQNLPITTSDPDLPLDSQTPPVIPQELNAPGSAWVEPEKPCEELDRGKSLDEPDALWKDREQAYIEDVYPVARSYSAERLVPNEWPVRSKVWSNDAYAAASWAAGDAGEARGWGPEAALTAAERWLDQRDFIWTDCEMSTGAAAGGPAEAFMRGAAAAPHSSEIDLRDLSVSSGEGSATLISGLSSHQLEARVSRYADQLRRLLVEARARDQDYPNRSTHGTSPAPLSRPHAPLSRPQAPLPRPHTPLLRDDAFLAGSFAPYNTEDLGGRGRGRLQGNKAYNLKLG